MQLPTNEATLSAYAVPKPAEGASPYSYEWKLLSFTRTAAAGEDSSAGGTAQLQEREEGNMKNSHSSQLELSGLEQGVYQFRVTVDSTEPKRHGEALANVTVLPRKSIPFL